MRLSFALSLLLLGTAAVAQQPPTPPDPNTPSLSLEEKITLTTDDVKKADALEKAQKSYLELVKPIQDHQDAAKKTIEDAHPGWDLEQGPTGWHFAKKQDKPAADKTKK